MHVFDNITHTKKKNWYSESEQPSKLRGWTLIFDSVLKGHLHFMSQF